MKARQRKAIVNRWRPKFYRFGCSVCYKGVWQRVSLKWWSREKCGGTVKLGPEREMKIDLAVIQRKAKPLSLKGL